MSQPIHNRGTAAEQGAAIRRQFEEQQQKRFSSQIQTDRLHHRDTPPPDDESAAAARRSSSTRRKKRPTPSSRRGAGPESEDVTSDDGGARRRDSTRSKRDSLRKRSTIANEPPPPSRAAAAAPAAEEDQEEEAPRSKRGSRALRKEAEGGTAAAAAAPVAARKKRGKEARDPEKEAAAAADEQDAEPAASHEPAEEEEHPSRAKEAAGAGGLMAALGLGGWAASNKKEHDGETEGEEPATEKPRQEKKTQKPVAAVFPSSGNGEGRRRNYAKKNGVAAAAPVYDGDGQPSESGAADPSEVPEEDQAEDGDDDEQHGGAVAGGAAAGAAAGAGAGAAAASHRDSIPLEKKGRVYPLTGIDNLALMLEDAGYQTACFSVYLFKTKLDYDTVLDFFEKLAEAYPKYRYVCELNPSDASKKDKAARKGKPFSPSSSDPNPGRKTTYSKNLKAGGMFRPARWRVDETFDVAQNIKTVRAENDGGDDDLFDLCGACLGDHFDFNKPLWEATLVHGLHTSEGARSALMIKIHHAFSDGQGMIQSYHSAVEAMANGMSVESKQAEIDSHIASASAKKKEAAKDAEKQGRDSQHPEEQKKIGSRNIKPTVGGTISHTGHTIRGLYMRRRKAFTYPDSAGKDAARRYGAQLGKNERPSTRLYAHSDGISMSDIKLIREAFSTPKVNLSLNDVACALLSRALRIAAETMADKQRSGKVTDKRIAVFIPISKRPKGDWTLANYTTGAIAWFRFHEPSRYGFESLLMQVNREMNRIKRSHLPGIWYNVFGSFAKRRFFMMPNYPIARQIFQSAYREYNVFTNVPGPSKPITFGKHEAFSYHVLPPSSPGKSTLAMGAISYAGEFSLAVSCDKVREFDEGHLPEITCQAFQQASQELVRVAKEKME